MKKKPRANCLLCGEECKRATTKFCSRACMNKYRTVHKIRQGGPKKTLKPKHCFYCDNVFMPIRRTNRFCCKTCAGKQRYEDGDRKWLEKAAERSRNRTPEHRARLSAATSKRMRGVNYTKGIGGTRNDIGHYVRSRWEANVCRILNYFGIQYKYESQTFELIDNDGIVCRYTPDMEVAEDVFIEVKGWETPSAKKKRLLMSSERPDIFIIYINEKEYKKLSNEFRFKIPNWEHDKKHGR